MIKQNVSKFWEMICVADNNLLVSLTNVWLVVVGTDGYAPSTFSMSMKHSTIELSPLSHCSRLSHSEVTIKTIIFLLFFLD